MPKDTVYTFSPGPGKLPKEVLLRAQAELLNWRGTGLSPMEMSHRDKDFTTIRHETDQTLRDLLDIPQDYHVLFLQGGASSQFGMVPMNLMGHKKKAAYIHSGAWAKKAIDEAKRYIEVDMVGEFRIEHGIHALPSIHNLSVTDEHAYLYYTDNETISGMEFTQIPSTNGISIPIVSDMTSSILSKPLNLRSYGLIYASAQKNLGHAGVTLVIINRDCLMKPMEKTPTMFQYETHVKEDSCYNTPPTYAWYFAGLMLDWIKDQGGVQAMDRDSKQKSRLIYERLDHSEFYRSPIAKENRSRLNIPFTLMKPELEKTFLEEAQHRGLIGLSGHRSVGGMRASLYLGMPQEGVQRLVNMMDDFEKKYR